MNFTTETPRNPGARWGKLPVPDRTDCAERAFWQSRTGLRDAPRLTDLRAPARALGGKPCSSKPAP